MSSLATFCLDNPSSISLKVDLALGLWKASMASCVRVELALSPTPLLGNLLTNLVVHLVAHLPCQSITLCLLDHWDELHENQSGLDSFGNNVLLVTRALRGECQ